MKLHHYFGCFRIALTIFFIVIVWHHAHWSVALAITFISFSIEGIAATLSVMGRALKLKSEDFVNYRKNHE